MAVPGKFKMIRFTSMLLTLLLLAPGSWASPFSDAKAAGLVLEKPDGFVVSKEGAAQNIQKLVLDVNKRRRAAYKKIADKIGVSVEQVAQESYLKRHPQ